MSRCAYLTAAMILCWTVTGNMTRVIDGDTFVADLSVWHGLTAREKVRVLGVDTPEMKRPTRDAGEAAKAFAEKWLSEGPVTVTSCKRDSFGRILGAVYRDRKTLAEDLIKAGHGITR